MIHILYAPGSIYGPCDEGCIHPKCEMEKMAAKQKCTSCKEPVGFSNRFTFIDEQPVHIKCIEPEGFEDLPEEDKPPTTSSLT